MKITYSYFKLWYWTRLEKQQEMNNTKGKRSRSSRGWILEALVVNWITSSRWREKKACYKIAKLFKSSEWYGTSMNWTPGVPHSFQPQIGFVDNSENYQTWTDIKLIKITYIKVSIVVLNSDTELDYRSNKKWTTLKEKKFQRLNHRSFDSEMNTFFKVQGKERILSTRKIIQRLKFTLKNEVNTTVISSTQIGRNAFPVYRNYAFVSFNFFFFLNSIYNFVSRDIHQLLLKTTPQKSPANLHLITLKRRLLIVNFQNFFKIINMYQ